MNPRSYDVSSYTDRELLNILSLTNPTDRELEARIVQMIRRYNTGQPTGDKYRQFFIDIYSHFFDVSDDEEDTDTHVIEGMTTNGEEDVVEVEDVTQDDGMIQPSSANTNTDGADVNDSTEVAKIDDKVALTRPLEYSKDQMNPLLKQIVRRTVSIDSQYRNRQFYGISTNYTFNLSEPLRDVVSLKLYSIQIPYSWYTVGSVYGANIIYIKGMSNGINNGSHDYSIGIPPGNYDQTGLITALNKSISDLTTYRMDVSFGMGNFFSYNNSTILTTSTISISNVIDEMNYSLVFTDPGYVNKTQTFGNTVVPIDRYGYNAGNIKISGNLNAFLGFNNANYDINSVYSARNFSGVLDNTISSYVIDSSNNTISLVSYHYTDIKTGNYYIPDNSLNAVNIVIPNGYYTEQTLFDNINASISANPYLDSSVSGLSLVNITNPYSANYPASYFKLTLRVLRNSPMYIPGDITVKNVVLLPDDNRIWIGQGSMFNFDLSTNELNLLKAETNSIENDFNSNASQFFLLQCIRPGYESNVNPSTYANISYTQGNLAIFKNDIKVSMESNYASTLSTFITSINNQISSTNIVSQSLNQNETGGVFNLSDTLAYVDETNTFNFSFDLNNVFTNSSYCVSFGNFLSSAFPQGTIYLKDWSDGSATSVFTSNTVDITNLLISDGNGGPATILTIFPNPTAYNSGDISWNILLYSSSESYQTATNIQNAITSFSYTTSGGFTFYPLKNTTVSYDNRQSQFTINLSIKNILTQNDYQLYFFDGTSTALWNQIDISSYQVGNYIYSLVTNIKTSIVSGYAPIHGQNFNLFEDTSFQLNCVNGAIDSTNNIIINIPANVYTRTTLLNLINNKLNANPITAGSNMYVYLNNTTNQEFIYFKVNIARVYTAADYRLVFYDTISFVQCYVGVSSVRNTSWDATLGWTLGYRNTEYDLSKYINSTGNAVVIGETALDIYPYKYFYIILDDYNQSRLNDGLVTLSLTENIISQPSYAPKQSFVCDASGNKVFIGSDSQPLTSNQIWSANQIYLDSQTTQSIYSSTPFIKDVFGIVPIKPGSAGSNYVEFGGSLQNQERLYFGPVTIYRMNIQLIDDKGDLVDLNGSEWSFSFICEQLYRSDAGGGN